MTNNDTFCKVIRFSEALYENPNLRIHDIIQIVATFPAYKLDTRDKWEAFRACARMIKTLQEEGRSPKMTGDRCDTLASALVYCDMETVSHDSARMESFAELLEATRR